MEYKFPDMNSTHLRYVQKENESEPQKNSILTQFFNSWWVSVAVVRPNKKNEHDDEKKR